LRQRDSIPIADKRSRARLNGDAASTSAANGGGITLTDDSINQQQ